MKKQVDGLKSLHGFDFFWMSGFFILFPLIVFFPRAIPGLLIYFAILSFVARGKKSRDLLKGSDVFYILALFLAYALLSVLWTEVPQFALKEIFKLLIYALSGMVLLNFVKNENVSIVKKYLNIIAYSMLLSVLILFANYVTDFKAFSSISESYFSYDLGSFRRGAHLCALFIFPLLIYFWQTQRKGLALLCLIGLFSVVYLSAKHTAFLVIIMTAGLMPFLWLFGRCFIKFFQLSLIIFFFFAPIVVEPFVQPALTYAENAKENDIKIPTSFLHRLKIWNFTSQKIIERPIQGYGFGSSRFVGQGQKTELKISLDPYLKGISEEQRQAYLKVAGRDGIQPKHFLLENLSLLPLHPHSAFLQIWLEVGLIGMLIASAFLFFLFEKGMNLVKRSQQMIFMGALFPSLVVVNMSYGLWQSWWVCSLFILAAIIQMMCHTLGEDKGASA